MDWFLIFGIIAAVLLIIFLIVYHYQWELITKQKEYQKLKSEFEDYVQSRTAMIKFRDDRVMLQRRTIEKQQKLINEYKKIIDETNSHS